MKLYRKLGTATILYRNAVVAKCLPTFISPIRSNATDVDPIASGSPRSYDPSSTKGQVRRHPLTSPYPQTQAQGDDTKGKGLKMGELPIDRISRDVPLKYSTSPAFDESDKVRQIVYDHDFTNDGPLPDARSKKDYEFPTWVKKTIVTLSLATFMIYFCVLREPNHMDDRIALDVQGHFPDRELFVPKKSM